MAGRNPTASTGPPWLRATSVGSVPRRAPPSRGGPMTRPSAPPCLVRVPRITGAVGGQAEQFLHGRPQAGPVPHDLRGPEQPPVEAFVIGAGQQTPANRPFGLFPTASTQEMSAVFRAVSTTIDSSWAWVPSSTAQSASCSPSKGRPRTRASASFQRAGSGSASGAGELLHVGADRVGQSQTSSAAREVIGSAPRSTEGVRATEVVEWRVDAAMQRSVHSAVDQTSCPGSLAVERQIDDQLPRAAPAKGPSRAADLNRSQNGHFDLGTGRSRRGEPRRLGLQERHVSERSTPRTARGRPGTTVEAACAARRRERCDPVPKRAMIEGERGESEIELVARASAVPDDAVAEGDGDHGHDHVAEQARRRPGDRRYRARRRAHRRTR